MVVGEGVGVGVGGTHHMIDKLTSFSLHLILSDLKKVGLTELCPLGIYNRDPLHHSQAPLANQPQRFLENIRNNHRISQNKAL